MQRHDEDNDEIADLRAAFRSLSHELPVDRMLEENLVRQLKARRLIGGHRGATQRSQPRQRIAVSWPVAAVAATLLFASGVVVGSIRKQPDTPDAAATAAVATARDSRDAGDQ